ncbi:hypothetical protein DH2020_035805 [Rehmannia glutinosa]|uniref:F-box domain-containing protein n=1 Tax=Rehmannia glutinosa TaxID=99300 RepID=A0ABR0V7G7_REHGL
MANQSQNTFLPSDIIFNILTKLPVKSLCRFKVVCREWNVLISSQDFVKEHLCHAKDMKNLAFQKFMYLGVRFSISKVFSRVFDFSTLNKVPLALPFGDKHVNAEILASCDGLVLLYKGRRIYVLWNPSTGAQREFSGLHMNILVRSCCRLYGIAYDASINVYKVIAAARISNTRESTVITVYNCRTGTCTYSKGFPYWMYRSQQGVMVNEVPHWLVSHREGVGCAIVYYDFASETFKEVPKPEWAENVSEVDLRAHNGMLCLIHFKRGCADIWVMENYGQLESWTKLYHNVCCPGNFQMRPIGLTHNEQVVMEIQQRRIDVYDPRTRIFTHKSMYTYHVNAEFGAATYVESLVSLDVENV